MPSLIIATTGLAFGSGLQSQTAIGAAGFAVVTDAIDAPVLALLSAPGTNPPTFTIDFDDTITVDDVVVFQYAPDPSFVGAGEATNTLQAPELLAGEITEVVSALAPGLWYFHAKVTSGSQSSPWSNTVSDTLGSSYVSTYYLLGF